MKNKICRKISKNIIKEPTTIIICVFIYFGMLWIISGAKSLLEIHSQRMENVDIVGTVFLADTSVIDEIKEIKGVQNATVFRQSMMHIACDEYTAEINLIGVEEHYLRTLYEEKAIVNFNGAMPYVIAEDILLETLENDDKEQMHVDAIDDYLLEVFLIQNQMVRIGGWIATESLHDEAYETSTTIPNVYTTCDWYDTLLNNMNTLDSANAPLEYKIILKNAYVFEKIQKHLEEISVTINWENAWNTKVGEWEIAQKEGMHQMIQGCLELLADGILVFFQGQLWKQKHRLFSAYLLQLDTSGRLLGKIYRGRILRYVMFAVILGIAIVIWKCFK